MIYSKQGTGQGGFSESSPTRFPQQPHREVLDQDWLHNLQVQCKMQMEAPLFKNYEEFPETAAEHLTERGVLLSVEP